MAKHAPITGAPSCATVIAFPDRRRLRADVPPFDPTNPAHIQAWESLYDFGRAQLRRQEGR